MKVSTRKALEASIAHWNRFATGTHTELEGIGAGDCALCQRFRHHDCSLTTGEKCPIYAKTGEPFCFNTPHKAVCKALWAYMNIADPNASPLTYQFFLTPKGQALAAAERDFLISLLPESAQ